MAGAPLRRLECHLRHPARPHAGSGQAGRGAGSARALVAARFAVPDCTRLGDASAASTGRLWCAGCRAGPTDLLGRSFDLAVSLFSGLPAEPASGDFIVRSAGDAQQIEVGWWPGDGWYPRAAFAYAHPAPAGFATATLSPAAAHWDTGLGEYVLDWDDACASPDPHRAALEFGRSSATGASAVGMVFYRDAGCVMTDDVVIVQPWSVAAEREWIAKDRSDGRGNGDGLPPHNIDLHYLVVALSRSIAEGGYLYEAKLYTKRVRQLNIEVPVDSQGEPDLERQRQIAAAAKRLDGIRSRLEEAGKWSKEARLA